MAVLKVMSLAKNEPIIPISKFRVGILDGSMGIVLTTGHSFIAMSFGLSTKSNPARLPMSTPMWMSPE